MAQPDDDGPPIGLTGARFGGGNRRNRARARRRATMLADAETAEFPQVGPLSVEARPELDADRAPGTDGDGTPLVGYGPVVGSTGARFGGQSRGERLEPEPFVEIPRPVAPPPTYAPAPGQFVPSPFGAESLAAESFAGESFAGEAFGADEAPVVRTVRPYVLTGGRTRAQLDLALETLVSAVNTAMPLQRPEHEAVVDLCAEPRSVAEIAALMQVPIGVAKVLVGDLAANGTVTVHATSAATGPDLALMERVLSGLRRL